jgi:EmrB/QacA subfamily drug resistance transporter
MKNKTLPVIVGTAFFMEQLDATIIAPAIPDIAQSLHIAPLNLNLTMTVYLLFSVAFIPTGAWLAERLGTRTVFQIALVLFALTSVICAMSTSIGVLVTARAIEGASAALMVPVGRSSIVHVTEKPQLVNALAWMITLAMMGPLFGPPLGGLLTTWLSWHWIFLINVPIALLCLIASIRAFPQIRQAGDGSFDVISWLLLSGVLASIIFLLENVRHGFNGLLLWIVTLIVLSLGYLYRSKQRRIPMIDFSLLGVPTFAASFWSGSLLRVGYGALPFLLPMMLQLGLGYTPIESGMVLLASGAIALATKTQTTRILRRWGFRTVMLVNGSLCVLALGVCALFRANWHIAFITLTVSVAGFFRAVQFNAVSAVAYAELPPQRIGAATTLNTMVQQLAIMMGISLSSGTVTLSAHWNGHAEVAPFDFSVAFIMIALFGALAMRSCLRLPRDAGALLSGHNPG